ncbi:hypothetical protein JL720_14583 [Aureococcus anophagefferens]|nr:hypothetical protein JL720_14583 [Aureococcus anophagefferens]
MIARPKIEWKTASSLRESGGARHVAHLESVRKKAVRESNKVDEISFINEMGLLDMQFDLKRRLEMEARIDEAPRCARLLAGVSSKQQAREKDKEDKLASQRIERAEEAAWAKLQDRLENVGGGAGRIGVGA